MKHGIGVLKFYDGNVYEGNFQKNQFNGYGTLRGKNWKYSGNWVKNLKHG